MLSAPLLFLSLAAALIAGAAIGFFSRPGPQKLVDRIREQSASFTAYHDDAEDRIQAANQRATALEAEAAALRSDHAEAERTIAALRGHGSEPDLPVTEIAETPPAAAPEPDDAPINPNSFRSSTRDDLTRIDGIDEALNTRLFGLGVLRFEDIAKLSAEDEMALEERLAVPVGRIAREQWRGQAARLGASEAAAHDPVIL